MTCCDSAYPSVRQCESRVSQPNKMKQNELILDYKLVQISKSEGAMAAMTDMAFQNWIVVEIVRLTCMTAQDKQ